MLWKKTTKISRIRFLASVFLAAFCVRCVFSPFSITRPYTLSPHIFLLFPSPVFPLWESMKERERESAEWSMGRSETATEAHTHTHTYCLHLIQASVILIFSNNSKLNYWNTYFHLRQEHNFKLIVSLFIFNENTTRENDHKSLLHWWNFAWKTTLMHDSWFDKERDQTLESRNDPL